MHLFAIPIDPMTRTVVLGLNLAAGMFSNAPTTERLREGKKDVPLRYLRASGARLPSSDGFVPVMDNVASRVQEQTIGTFVERLGTERAWC
ncbi:hypothetical protein [Anaeromyxobacter paludicola]|uniref:hypothetical protein n=1 Tax=Anaeromyxobacter paludicola TaxID=2918171 RepID=UPI0020BE48E4|nr:hypothetical protein [Anaeromyxobacter paludicola]